MNWKHCGFKSVWSRSTSGIWSRSICFPFRATNTLTSANVPSWGTSDHLLSPPCSETPTLRSWLDITVLCHGHGNFRDDFLWTFTFNTFTLVYLYFFHFVCLRLRKHTRKTRQSADIGRIRALWYKQTCYSVLFDGRLVKDHSLVRISMGPPFVLLHHTGGKGSITQWVHCDYIVII